MLPNTAAVYCILLHTVAYCCVLLRTAAHCPSQHCCILLHTVAYCCILLHIAAHCPLQHYCILSCILFVTFFFAFCFAFFHHINSLLLSPCSCSVPAGLFRRLLKSHSFSTASLLHIFIAYLHCILYCTSFHQKRILMIILARTCKKIPKVQTPLVLLHFRRQMCLK